MHDPILHQFECEAMTTVKQRNMVNRKMKLAIRGELQNLFHPIFNKTKEAAEETRKELAPMRKTLTGIDGALAAQHVEALNRATDVKSSNDTTFGFYMEDGQLSMGIKTEQLKGNALIVDTEYKLTIDVRALIELEQPRANQWNSSDYQAYNKTRCTDQG